VKIGNRSVPRDQVEDDLVRACADQADDAIANSGDVAPRNDRVKQLFRPGRLQLVGLPAEAQQIVPIVLGAKVDVRVRIAYRSPASRPDANTTGRSAARKASGPSCSRT
jgi:hypothetical protein